MCTAKAFQQEMKFQLPAFLEILRALKSEDKDGRSGEDTSTEVEKINREDSRMRSGQYVKNLRQSFPKTYPKVFLLDG